MQLFNINTIHGFVNVTLQKINDETLLLKSDVLLDNYFIKDGWDEETQRNFVEIRSYIGNVLIKSFWLSLDFELEEIKESSLELIIDWLLKNNN